MSNEAQDIKITRLLDRIYSAVATDPAFTAAARRTLNKSEWQFGEDPEE